MILDLKGPVAVAEGRVPGPRAKEVFAAMLGKNLSVDQACQELGIAAVNQDELKLLCRELLAAIRLSHAAEAVVLDRKSVV